MIPYIIVSPFYRNSNAGVRALFMLCDLLRSKGHEAYMYAGKGAEHSFNAPDLWDNIPKAKELIDAGAIMIYPEIFLDNIFNSHRPVVWILNKQGINHAIPTKFYWLKYNESIPEERLLDLDIIESKIFNPQLHLTEDTIIQALMRLRITNGSSTAPDTLYIGKGARCPEIQKLGKVIEITASYPESREELSDLLKKSSYFYTCDLTTAMIAEARLCGTPAVLLENSRETLAMAKEYYKNTNASTKGIAWHNTPEEKEKAKSEKQEYIKEYYEHYSKCDGRVNRFIELTQNMEAI
jgi:hypothetical protein